MNTNTPTKNTSSQFHIFSTSILAVACFGLATALTSCTKRETKVELYPSGSTQLVYNVTWYLEQWVKDGPFEEFYTNGKPMKKGKYSFARLMGKYKEWDEEGDWMEGKYRFGQKEGIFNHYYHDTGTKKRKENYKNGVLHGNFTEWYPNGQKKSEGSYAFKVDRRGRTDWFSSVKEGEWREWDEDGEPR